MSDEHVCQPILGDDGEIIATVLMDPDADERAREALRALVEAARRKHEADVAADPTIGQRQAEGRARIRRRARPDGDLDAAGQQ